MHHSADDITRLYAAPFGQYGPGEKAQWHIARVGRNPGRGLWADFVRSRAKRHLRNSKELFDVDYRDMKLRLLPGENTCDMHIALTGVHPEEDEFDAFEREVAGKQVFVDVGANIGLYSLLAARNLGEGGRVMAFEPDPRTSQKLRRNLALNGADRVSVVQKAVADAPGEMRLFMVSDRNAGRNSLRDDLGQTGEAVSVEVSTLLSELQSDGIAHIDVLKIDVEGFEDRALMPFFDTAPRALWPRYIMIEILHRGKWARDVLGELQAHGYATAFTNEANVHLRLEAEA